MPVTTPNPKGKIARLCALLREDILQGRFKPGALLPAQSELSRKYSVAEATAGAAVGQLAAEGLAVRIHGRGSFVAERLPTKLQIVTFVGRMRGQRSVQQRADRLIWIEEETDLCNQRGWTPKWHYLSGQNVQSVEELAENLAENRGVIVLTRFGLDLAGVLYQRDVPVVAILGPMDPWPQVCYPWICFSRSKAGQLATSHLVSLGYRTIAFLGIAGLHTSMLRMNGFLEVVREHSLPVPAGWLLESTQDDLYELRRQLLTVLKANPRPRAICCATGYLARNAELVVLEAGLKVPDDIAIIACDSSADVLNAPVPISTVGVPIRSMCQRAIEILEQIEPGYEDRNSQPVEPIEVPQQLTVRDSCGANLRGSTGELLGTGDSKGELSADIHRDLSPGA